ncbi:MAG: hypothetical protein ACAH95_04705 [Fimbriimonas sp.]
MRYRVPFVVATLSLLVLAGGCGGGGQEPSTDIPGGDSSELGPISYRGTLNKTPTYGNGGLASVIGLAGDFNTVTLRDISPTPLEDRLAYTFDGINLRTIDGAGDHDNEIVSLTNTEFASLDYGSGGAFLYYCQGNKGYKRSIATGSTTLVISNAGKLALSPRSALAFTRSDTQLFYKNTSGVETGIFNAGSGETIDGFDWIDEDWIVFCSGGGIYKINKNGTGLFKYSFLVDVWRMPKMSKDGKYFTFCPTDGEDYRVFVARFVGATDLTVVYPETLTSRPESIDWSADSSAFYVTTFDQRILRCELGGYPVDLPKNPLNGGGTSLIACAPLTSTASIVGSLGSYSNHASGMLFSQTGARTASMVMWDATTPSTSNVTFQADASTDQNLVFNVTADRILRLSYTRDNTLTFNTALAATLVVNGALVTLDGESGDVVSVLAYNALTPPKMERRGDELHFTGAFVSVHDKSGVNVAPTGAKEVVVGRGGVVIQN